MTADQLTQLATQVLFVLIFLVSAARTVLRPLRVNADLALFFGAASLLTAESWAVEALGFRAGRTSIAISESLLMALPYLLLRLADDFMEVPRVVLWAAAGGLCVSVLSFFIRSTPLPLVLILAYVVYFVVFTLFVVGVFLRMARLLKGVTQHMQATGFGSLCLGAGDRAGRRASGGPDRKGLEHPRRPLRAWLRAWLLSWHRPALAGCGIPGRNRSCVSSCNTPSRCHGCLGWTPW